MKPTQTGIAVALALAVVALFFILPGLSLFSDTTNTQTPMPTENTTVAQLQIIDEVIGTGAVAAQGDSVTVNYVGSLTDGKVFDASANYGTTGYTFNLGTGQVIKGWDDGIVGMKEGGKRTLVIPASLAYGSQAIGDVIPANSDLVFQVELLKVQKAR